MREGWRGCVYREEPEGEFDLLVGFVDFRVEV